MTDRFTVAAAQYPLTSFARWADYAAKLEAWVTEAAQTAQLLVFPEYAGMELASLDGAEAARDLQRSIAAVSARREEVDAYHCDLARRSGATILAGTLPWRDGAGAVRNLARVFTPRGGVGVQDKLMMTRFEDETWGVQAGHSVRVFETDLCRIGVAICFDVEFPLIARAMAEAGADVILAPSCTDTAHGYWRVRIGAQARALENQLLVVQAPLVGDATWLTACDVNTGAAGVFGPPDKGFPTDGVVTQGAMDQPGWVYASVDLAAAQRVRRDGAVFTAHSWPKQPGAAALSAQVVRI